MAQANNNTSMPTAGRRSGDINRRSALQLIGSGAAASATLSTAAGAQGETAIAKYFAIWKGSLHELRTLDRAADEAFRTYEATQPDCPPSLRLESYTGSRTRLVAGAQSTPERDKDGRPYRRICASWFEKRVAQLERTSTNNAPDLIWARKCLSTARTNEAAADAAYEATGHRSCEDAWNLAHVLIQELEKTILAIDAGGADDLRMQAEVLRDCHLGFDLAPAATRFLNAVMSSRFQA